MESGSVAMLTMRMGYFVMTTMIQSGKQYVSDSTESDIEERGYTDSVSCSPSSLSQVESIGGSGIGCLDWSMSVTVE